jgi:hypothetical protein
MIFKGGSGGGFNGPAGLGQSGRGGGSGGYVKAIIPNPSASYSYQIGSGGSGGSAGVNGFGGGTGSPGIIIIREYY